MKYSMIKCSLAVAAVLNLANNAHAKTNDVATLEKVVVWADADRPIDAGGTYWRKLPPGVMVRQQSEYGALTDISINGSAFSEAGIIFNGAPVRNTQTEHFNADLAVPMEWLNPPHALTGLNLFRSSAGHSAGSFEARMNNRPGRGGSVTAGVGIDGLVFGRGNALETFDVGEEGIGWAGAFVDRTHASRIDGYPSDSLDRFSAGGRMGFGTEDWTFDAIASFLTRDFDCRGAYGTNEKYDAWEEDTLGMISADWRYDAGDDQASEISLLWTRERDKYRLYRANPDFYENKHWADTVTLKGSNRHHWTDAFFLDTRAEAAVEVYSTQHHNNYSGINPKTKNERFNRSNGSIALLPGYRAGNWEFAAGAAADLYSDFSSRCSPAGGITWFSDDNYSISLSYREGSRMPSFTELTYDSPDSLGTRDLTLQRTRTISLDVDYASEDGVIEAVRGGVFIARADNLIDWLKATPESPWTATQMAPVVTGGASGAVTTRVTDDLTLTTDGSIYIKDTKTDYYASRYALDYPIAALALEAKYRIVDGLFIRLRQGMEVWKSNPVRRGSNIRCVSRIESEWEMPFCRDLKLTVGMHDIFNQAFEVLPGQKMQGFTGFMAMTYSW